MTVKALIFDLGGVVLESPFHVMKLFARESHIDPNQLVRILNYSSAESPWAKLERGEITRETFGEAIETEAKGEGLSFSGIGILEAFDKHITVRNQALEAIRKYRAQGFKVAALTNIWPTNDTLHVAFDMLVSEFDVFVESWRVGARKPELPIYERVLAELQVEPTACIFLDDLGENLKPARAMGMRTIKVSDIDESLEELQSLLR